jgi:hypothetical protein
MRSSTHLTRGRLAIRSGLLAAAVVCGLASFARAETVTATITTVDPFVVGTVYVNGIGDVYGAIAAIDWQGDPSNPAPFNGPFTTYCIDLNEPVNIGGTFTFTVEPLADAPKGAAFPSGTPTTGMGLAKADEIEELFGQHYDETLPAANGIDREAFQLAIWNIVYDTDTSVTTGQGSMYAESDVDPNAISIANGWLADAANPQNQIFDDTELAALVGPDGVQDQVVQFPPLGNGTPLAPAAFSGGLLMACLGLMRFRQYRRMNERSI